MSREGNSTSTSLEEGGNPFHNDPRGFNHNAYISQATHFGLQMAVRQEFGRINETIGALQESIANLGRRHHSSSSSHRTRSSSRTSHARDEPQGHRHQGRHHDRPHMRNMDGLHRQEYEPPPQGQPRRWADYSSSSPSPPRQIGRASCRERVCLYV